MTTDYKYAVYVKVDGRDFITRHHDYVAAVNAAGDNGRVVRLRDGAVLDMIRGDFVVVKARYKLAFDLMRVVTDAMRDMLASGTDEGTARAICHAECVSVSSVLVSVPLGTDVGANETSDDVVKKLHLALAKLQEDVIDAQHRVLRVQIIEDRRPENG